MENKKKFLITYTYHNGDQDFIYRKTFIPNDSSNVQKEAEQFLNDIECINEEWENNKVEVDMGLVMEIDHIEELTENEYTVLNKFL